MPTGAPHKAGPDPNPLLVFCRGRNGFNRAGSESLPLCVLSQMGVGSPLNCLGWNVGEAFRCRATEALGTALPRSRMSPFQTVRRHPPPHVRTGKNRPGGSTLGRTVSTLGPGCLMPVRSFAGDAGLFFSTQAAGLGALAKKAPVFRSVGNRGRIRSVQGGWGFPPVGVHMARALNKAVRMMRFRA